MCLVERWATMFGLHRCRWGIGIMASAGNGLSVHCGCYHCIGSWLWLVPLIWLGPMARNWSCLPLRRYNHDLGHERGA